MSLTITGLSKVYPNGVQSLKGISLTIGNNMFGLLGKFPRRPRALNLW
jgi:ABC-2 type transport system ATP-binding protein